MPSRGIEPRLRPYQRRVLPLDDRGVFGVSGGVRTRVIQLGKLVPGYLGYEHIDLDSRTGFAPAFDRFAGVGLTARATASWGDVLGTNQHLPRSQRGALL